MPIPGVSDLMNAKAKKGKGKRVTMITLCAWCKKELSRRVVRVDDPDEDDPMYSHGICKKCAKEMEKGL